MDKFDSVCLEQIRSHRHPVHRVLTRPLKTLLSLYRAQFLPVEKHPENQGRERGREEAEQNSITLKFNITMYTTRDLRLVSQSTLVSVGPRQSISSEISAKKIEGIYHTNHVRTNLQVQILHKAGEPVCTHVCMQHKGMVGMCCGTCTGQQGHGRWAWSEVWLETCITEARSYSE